MLTDRELFNKSTHAEMSHFQLYTNSRISIPVFHILGAGETKIRDQLVQGTKYVKLTSINFEENKAHYL